MTSALRIISSMATRQLLMDLLAAHQHESGQSATLEAVGGVDAAKRVLAGEDFDVVVLAARAIDELIVAGRIVAGSRVDLVDSGVYLAVRAGAPRPAIATEDDIRRAVLDAHSVGYSTGPSGVYLAALFERWGISEALKGRTVQAPAGVPVGSLLAKGEVALGFQQLSELMNQAGIEVLGPLPPAIQIMTTFSAGLSASSGSAQASRTLMAFMASPAPAVAAIKRANGMLAPKG